MTDSQKPLNRNGRCHPACPGETSLKNGIGDFSKDVHLAGVLEELHEEEFVTEDRNNDVTNSEGKEQPVEAVFHLAKHKQCQYVSNKTNNTYRRKIDFTEALNSKDS